MSFKLNPITGNLDLAGLTQSSADALYVNVTGDTMTGTLDLQTNALILQATDGSRWQVTINTDGSLQTTVIPTGTVGSPMGLLLVLTYAT